MSNTFEIIGKLSIAKESEKFKPYKKEISAKNWVTTKLLFNVVAGDNRHMLELKSGHFENESNKIYTFTKAEGDKKCEKFEVPFKDRLKPEIVAKVAEFKKFVVDLEEYGVRYKLEKALEKSKTTPLSDEELTELGIADIEKAVADSKNKRKEFIDETDYLEAVYKLISSNKFKDKLFKIQGNIEYSYSPKTRKFYKRLAPSRIYLSGKDAVPTSTAQITLFYNKESLDTSLLKKTKKYSINGYVFEYDRSIKKNIPCPVSIVVDTSKDETDEKSKKLNDLIITQFTIKDKSVREFGVKVKLLDGSQKVEIASDMLTQFQKDMLSLEAITMDDIRKEIGGDVYGEKVQEMIVINAAKGYSRGSKDTIYNSNDFIIEDIDIKDGTLEFKTPDNDDIFSDLDIN